MEKKLSKTWLFFLIFITLLFFASSSLLARAALLGKNIDPFSFTFFRLFFGSLTLIIIIYLKNKSLHINFKKNWISSFFLFLYAITFSYAYIDLDAGIGALILFAIVQLLIIVVAIIKKENITKYKLLGIILAFLGLVYLLIPSEKLILSTPHVLLMIISGIAWGTYTIFGKKTTNPLKHTGDNFIKATFILMIYYILFIDNIYFNNYGIFLAFLSGGITSSIGYLIWYFILPKLEIITSGIVQLIVPPLSIFLGIILLDEVFTFKLFLSTNVILIGITIAILNSKNR